MTAATTFVQRARLAAVAWKEATPALPEAARRAAPYGLGHGDFIDLCLPLAFAEYNLLPDARLVALDRFGRAGVCWHHGTRTCCGNHLLSSQVQCANALAPMISDPDAIRRTFGGVLDIAEVLPAKDPSGDPADLVAFEWIGLIDRLHEQFGATPRTRGAHYTSADALIRYRTGVGEVEVALIEWKYTEQYEGDRLDGDERKMEVRHDRYRDAWEDPDGPVTAGVPYESLFVEPFYQLFRLQLLADAMEQAHELGAERVRLVYAGPGANEALWSSLQFDAFRQLRLADQSARNVGSVWRQLLRRPDRFVLFDTAELVKPGAQTSPEFVSRYGHLAGSVDEGAFRAAS